VETDEGPKLLDNESDKRFGWSRNVFEHPESLLFWFEFFETDGELNKFSVPALGIRPKVEKNN
jgi:hypothetical protein